MTTCTEALSEQELKALRLTASHPAEVVDANGEVIGEMPNSLERRLLATVDALAAREAVLVGALQADIETLREMAHDFYEGGRPITKEQLDAFCAVGGEEKE
ncbi:hypothetical protein LCGC14_2742270 [marine sediment metagenome]|uniref:Uncharacterized protein n=1 Tax=marine sediment metagenome TaxID=412755 RepID=A0A0F9BVU9_9ZZZZ